MASSSRAGYWVARFILGVRALPCLSETARFARRIIPTTLPANGVVADRQPPSARPATNRCRLGSVETPAIAPHQGKPHDPGGTAVAALQPPRRRRSRCRGQPLVLRLRRR